MNTPWSRPTKYIVGVSLALLGIALLYLIRLVIPMLIIAALIAVIVRPIVLWLQQRVRLPRGLAVMVVYLGLAILVPLALLFIIPAIIDALRFVLNLDYQSILQGGLDWLRSWLASVKAAQLPMAALDAWIDQTVDVLLTNLQQVEPAVAPALPSLATILRSLRSVVTTTFGVAADLVGAVVSQVALVIFTFLASIYMSLSAHTYRGAFLRLVPAAYRPEFDALLGRIEHLWGAFFRGQLTLMLVIGLVSGLGLAVLGVPGALYLGIIAGLLELIPNLGPLIATIPAVIVALLQGSSYLPFSPLFLAVVVLLFYVLLQQVENNLIVPRVLGEAVELSPLVVMIGVLVGASTAGILGALLATPVIATAREIVRYLYRKMLGEAPFPPEDVSAEPAAPSSIGWYQRLRTWVQRLVQSRPLASLRHVSDVRSTPNNEPDMKDDPQR